MNVLVTGGTGFVGGILVNLLCARNDRATIVTRRPEEGRTARVGVSFAGWLPDLSRHEAVVNLAGASVSARRWNEAYKRELVESRVDRTRALVQALGKCDKRPRVLVNASAVGYYGDRGDELLDEDSAPASGFLPDLCVAWEREALEAERHGVRVVNLRIGIVLGRFGGALEKMAPIFKLGLGGPFGAGAMWLPWIHVNDCAGLVLHAIDDESLRGAVNAVSPGVVRNKEFARTLGKVLSRPAILPVPPFALKLAVGEFAAQLLASERVAPKQALASGYRFQWPELEPALKNCLQLKDYRRSDER